MLEENQRTENAWQTIAKPQEGTSVCFSLTTQTCIQIDGDDKVLEIQEGGFAICIEGKIYAYRNHCPHVGSPLDWLPNQFFSEDGQSLMCHTHGALFEPTTGDCISGPCLRGLYPLPVEYKDDDIQVPLIFSMVPSL